MKTIYALIVILFSVQGFCQAPEIEWQNTIGSASDDYATSIIQTLDNGYLTGGFTKGGATGDKTDLNIGLVFEDYWILKLDNLGNIVWQKTIGGTNYDGLFDMIQCSDGNYLIGGESNSEISGVKTEACRGDVDFWILKIDPSGDIIWQKTIGSGSYDQLFAMQETADGGFILGGVSGGGISGDKTEVGHGSSDYWVVKINSAGIIQWQNTIGAPGWDWFTCLDQTTDGGYILGGYSQSGMGGDKSENNYPGGANMDLWIVKIDSIGNIQWDNTIQAPSFDGLFSISQTNDDGYILGAQSSSAALGDKTLGCFGSNDFWVLKLNNEGNIEWQQVYGTVNNDELTTVRQTADGGFLISGSGAYGVSGNKTVAGCAGSDFWLIKTDAYGSIIWQKTAGGNSADGYDGYYQMSNMQITSDDGVVINGVSLSGISCDKSEANWPGGYDYWIVKFEGLSCTIPTGLFSDNITSTQAKAHWNSVLSAEKYQLFYREIGGTTWNKLIAESNFKNIYGLSPETNYEYKVRTKCDGENTMFSPVSNFTTLPLKAGEVNNQFIIYPNPSSENIIITLSSSILTTHHSPLTITDLSGKTIAQYQLTSSSTVIDISNYASGIYFINLISGNNTFSEKFIKN